MGTVHRPCDSGLRHRLKYAGKQDIPGQASSAKHLTTAGQYADATASSQPQRALDFVASRTSQAAADIDMRLSAISPFSWPLCVSKIHPSGDFRDAKSQSTAAPNFPSVPLSSPPKPSTVPLSTPRKPPSVLILLRPVLRSKVPDTFYPNHAPAFNHRAPTACSILIATLAGQIVGQAGPKGYAVLFSIRQRSRLSADHCSWAL
jgi:hypothetical protein